MSLFTAFFGPDPMARLQAEQDRQATELARAQAIYPGPTFDQPAMPKPMALPKELVAGPTVGYRAWKIGGGMLMSVGTDDTTWRPGRPMMARCRGWKPPHPYDAIPPVSRCSCGVYAMKAPAPDWPAWSQGDLRHAFGLVGMWGRVIEHENGYRAQYAYPIALFREVLALPPGFPAVPEDHAALDALAARYGIPVVQAP